MTSAMANVLEKQREGHVKMEPSLQERWAPCAHRQLLQLPLPGRGEQRPVPTRVVRKSLTGLLYHLPEAVVTEDKSISSGSRRSMFPSP